MQATSLENMGYLFLGRSLGDGVIRSCLSLYIVLSRNFMAYCWNRFKYLHTQKAHDLYTPFCVFPSLFVRVYCVRCILYMYNQLLSGTINTRRGYNTLFAQNPSSDVDVPFFFICFDV